MCIRSFDPGRRRPPGRRFGTRAVLLATTLAVTLVACDAPRAVDRLLRQERLQEAGWYSLGIHDYAFDTRVIPGFIGPSPVFDSMHVIVRRDTIQSVFDLQAKTYVDRTRGFTVPQLFAAARAALAASETASGDTQAIVQYDPTFHFPTLVLSSVPDEGGLSAGALLPNPP